MSGNEDYYFNLFCINYGIKVEGANEMLMDNTSHNISYIYLYNCDENDDVWKILCNIKDETIFHLQNYMMKQVYSWKLLYLDKIKGYHNVFISYMIWLEWKHHLNSMINQGKVIPLHYVDIVRNHTINIISYDINLGSGLVGPCLDIILSNYTMNEIYPLLLGVTKLSLNNPSIIINKIINRLRECTSKAEVYNVLFEVSYIICINNLHYPSLYYLYKTFTDEFRLKNDYIWVKHIYDVMNKVISKCSNPIIVCNILLYGLPISFKNEKGLESSNADTKKLLYELLNKAREFQFSRMK